jgi:hypothetical protein|tara:strand:- start:170 stop:1009 length:840 start_codon:yes stop_codon:yes gene_type:complete
MKFNQPIFILGLSRSGTTILYKLLTSHKDTAYFDNYSSKFYKRPYLFRFIPLLMKYRKMRYNIDRPRSDEGWVWNRFYDSYQYLDESHATEKIKNYYYEAIKYQLKAFDATRFVSKNPRNCMRLRWLNEMFPNAYYIIISRDTKSVISSMYQKVQKKRKKWNEKFPNTPNNFVGYAHIKKIIGEEYSDMEACIQLYDLYMKSMHQDLPLITDRTITIQYEEFVKDPVSIIKKLYKFINLDWYAELNKSIPKELEQGNNEKWKLLPEKEKKVLLDYIESN